MAVHSPSRYTGDTGEAMGWSTSVGGDAEDPASAARMKRLGTRMDWNPGIVEGCSAGLWVGGRPIVAGTFREATTWMRQYVAAFPFR